MAVVIVCGVRAYDARPQTWLAQRLFGIAVCTDFKPSGVDFPSQFLGHKLEIVDVKFTENVAISDAPEYIKYAPKVVSFFDQLDHFRRIESESCAPA